MLENALTVLAVLASSYLALSLCVSLLGLLIVAAVVAMTVRIVRRVF